MPTSSAPSFSLVVPCYNERANVGRLLTEVCEVLGRMTGDSYEVIVVDDNSPDGTREVVAAVARGLPHVRLLGRQNERGLATAVVHGWRAARAELLGVIDADLQHPPATLGAMLSTASCGADLVVASRLVPGGGVSDWSASRRVLSRTAQLLAQLLLRQARLVKDPLSGFFLVRRDAISLPALRPLGYKILLEVLTKGRLQKIVEVPYVFQERTEGGSKVTWRQYWEYLIHLWRLRSAE